MGRVSRPRFRPDQDITAANVISVLRKIENRPAAETARRIRQRMSAVFVYAIASGRAENDPAAAVQKAMRPVKKGRQPPITDLEQAREILRHADATPASPVTKLALRLLALTALRPGTLITTPWTELDELDPERPIWQVPATRMKLRLQYKGDDERDHLVPLSTQAIGVIKAVRKLTGRTPYLFPNHRHAHRPASEKSQNGKLLERAREVFRVACRCGKFLQASTCTALQKTTHASTVCKAVDEGYAGAVSERLS
jgi:integrase